MTTCPVPTLDIGAARGVLYSIDCNVQSFSKAGYLALTGPQSFFAAAVISLLVIYVGVLGVRLMFGIGNPRLSQVGVTALKIGFVMALAFNWTVFQTLVFDLTSKGPIEVAGVISRAMVGTDATLASDPLNGIQLVYDELSQDAALSAASNPAELAQTTELAPPKELAAAAAPGEGLNRSRDIFLYSAVGVPAVAMIAIGILTTVGPLFIALSLIGETAGLFVGWVRATLAFSILSMLAWIANLVTLTTLEPWLVALHKSRVLNQPNPQVAGIITMVIDIFAAAEAALIVGSVIIACGLRIGRRSPTVSGLAEPARVTIAPAVTMSRAAQLAQSMQPYAGALRRNPGGIDVATVRTTQTIAAATRADGRPAQPGAGAQARGTYRRPSAFDRSRRGEGRN